MRCSAFMWPMTGSTAARRFISRRMVAVILEAHLESEVEQRSEAAVEFGVAIDLAADVANEAAEAGAQELERAPGTLELVRMGVAADHDGGALGDAQIALAQRHAVAPGESDKLDDRPGHQPRIRRGRPGPWLH